MFFGWLRERAKNAVLAGCGDAIVELDNHGTQETAGALAALRARLQPALPGPESTAEEASTPPARARRRAE